MNCEMFGRHAEYFESQIVPLWQDIYDTLVSRSGISLGETVLDVGTGTGEVALRVSKRVGPGGKVVAIDVQDEMLDIARRKARGMNLQNLDFRRMSLEGLKIQDSHFDSVVGNYSLCCCFDYQGALSECLRVLKPGGRLTYNHSGPTNPMVSETIYDIFEDYKPRHPSERLKALRASDEAQMEAVEKYRNPKLAVAALKRAGFRNIEFTVIPRTIHYPNAAAYVDRMLEFDWRPEVEEMEPAEVERLRGKATRELSSLVKGPGFSAKDETVYFTATKATGS